MCTTRNVALIALISGAYISNPDEASFQRYLENTLKKEGSHWLESKVMSFVAINSIECKNYYLFSLVKVPLEQKVTYLGIFGNWFRLPISQTNNIK
jgi:hypothetical protein